MPRAWAPDRGPFATAADQPPSLVAFGLRLDAAARLFLNQGRAASKSVSPASWFQLFTLTESLGGVESLIEHPAIMTHASRPEDVLKGLGIDEGLVRLSVGSESIDDLLAELEEALS